MNTLPDDLAARILQLSPEGVVVCRRGEDGQWPVEFVNPAFERLVGYGAQELIGRDLRLLQGQEREQEGRQRIRTALQAGRSCRVLMRNYRSDGAQFWNEMLLEPVAGQGGAPERYIAFYRDAGERLRVDPKPVVSRDTFGATSAVPALGVLRDDRLTGLYNKEYFEELLQRDWAIAQREQRRLSMMLFDIDQLGAYNDTFGRVAGDACIKRVARAIGASLRRGSDLAARLEGGTVVTVTHGMDLQATATFARTLADRVREQHIHHPRSKHRYVTVSAGVASLLPEKDQTTAVLLERAGAALRQARQNGGNCVSQV
jgi:diguanylate cyclase (GGDEF)-like protein/PAS domain S-box-containing protein